MLVFLVVLDDFTRVIVNLAHPAWWFHEVVSIDIERLFVPDVRLDELLPLISVT